MRPGHQKNSDRRRQVVALAELVAELPATVERLLERRDRLVVLVGEEARLRALLQQLGALGGRQPVPEPERTRILRGRFAVRAELRPRARAAAGA